MRAQNPGKIPVTTHLRRFRSAVGLRLHRGRWLTFGFPLAMILLSACATSTPWPEKSTGAGASAETYFSQGKYEQAATEWQREALDAGPREAAGLRVRAADAWLLAGERESAEANLRWVGRSDLSDQDQARLDLVLADLALLQNRPDEAQQLLHQARPALASGSRSRYDGLIARTEQMLSSPAYREISRVAQLSAGMDFYDPYAAVEIMQILEQLSSGELAIRADNPRAERQLTGWLDLALTVRQNLVIADEVSGAMYAWKNRHPHHLLNAEQALDTWLRYRQQFTQPRKVAILLPASGRLQAAGEAIRDGIMTAYLERPGGAEILFFPTGDDPQSAISAYFNALDAGVDRIIGPLRRESIESMLNLAGMATPVLALNDLPEGFTAPAYLEGQLRGMSLSQDREAAAVALHARESGYRNAMVLAPESTWGDRMARAFEVEFLHEDEDIVVATRYLESQNDHSAVLQRALRIDESKARKTKLENTLQMTLEFEPTRRNDIDVIFMAANSTQARQIRPQLRFHDAGDIPVYATGRIFSGQPDPARNQDLNGVRFPATAWQLAHTSKDEIPALDSIRGGGLGSLFALGQDAWNLLPWLELMNKDPEFSFPGQSGNYLAAGGYDLLRKPQWAEFSRGRPIPLPMPVSAPSSPGPAPQ
jgi:outer membrane PBP1 activator LpoA protein